MHRRRGASHAEQRSLAVAEAESAAAALTQRATKEAARQSGLDTDLELEREARHALHAALDAQAGAAAHAATLEAALRERLPELRGLVEAMASEACALSQRLVAAPDAARAAAAAARAADAEEQSISREIARNRRERALLGRVADATAAALDAERAVGGLRASAADAALAIADELRPELAGLRGSLAALDGDGPHPEIDAFQALVRRAEEEAGVARRAADAARAAASASVRDTAERLTATAAERDALLRALALVRAMRPRDAVALVAARLRALTAAATATARAPSPLQGKASPTPRPDVAAAAASTARSPTAAAAAAATTRPLTPSPRRRGAGATSPSGSPVRAAPPPAPDDLAVALDAIYGPLPLPQLPAAPSPGTRAAWGGSNPSPRPSPQRQSADSPSPGHAAARVGDSAAAAVVPPAIAPSGSSAADVAVAGPPTLGAKPAWIARALSTFAAEGRAGAAASGGTASSGGEGRAGAASSGAPPRQLTATAAAPASVASSSATADIEAIMADARVQSRARRVAVHDGDVRRGRQLSRLGAAVDGYDDDDDDGGGGSGDDKRADRQPQQQSRQQLPRYMRPRSVDGLRAAAAREAAARRTNFSRGGGGGGDARKSASAAPPPWRPGAVEGRHATAVPALQQQLRRRRSDAGALQALPRGGTAGRGERSPPLRGSRVELHAAVAAYGDADDGGERHCAPRPTPRRDSVPGDALRRRRRADAAEGALAVTQPHRRRHVSFSSPPQQQQHDWPVAGVAVSSSSSAMSRSPVRTGAHRPWADPTEAAAAARGHAAAAAAIVSPGRRPAAAAARNASAAVWSSGDRSRATAAAATRAVRDAFNAGWAGDGDDNGDGDDDYHPADGSHDDAIARRLEGGEHRRASSDDYNPLVALATMSASLPSDDGGNGSPVFRRGDDDGSRRSPASEGSQPSSPQLGRRSASPGAAPVPAALPLPPSPPPVGQQRRSDAGVAGGGRHPHPRGPLGHPPPRHASPPSQLAAHSSPSAIVAAFLEAATAAANEVEAADGRRAPVVPPSAGADADGVRKPRAGAEQQQQQRQRAEGAVARQPQAPQRSHSVWASVFGGAGGGRHDRRLHEQAGSHSRGSSASTPSSPSRRQQQHDAAVRGEELYEASLLSPPSAHSGGSSRDAGLELLQREQQPPQRCRPRTATTASVTTGVDRLGELARPRRPANPTNSDAPVVAERAAARPVRRRSPSQPAVDSYSLRWRQQQQQQQASDVASALIAAAAAGAAP